jgi:glycosyltransferase involved in cell wall biosynthesis
MTTSEQPAPSNLPVERATASRGRRIAIACFASDGGQSGIGQYLLQVVRRLPELAPRDQFVLFAPRRDAAMWQDLGPNASLALEDDRWDAPAPSLLWHSLALPQRLRAHGCDAVFLPAGNRRLGLRYGVPSVATVHDLSQLHVRAKYDGVRMLYATRVLPALIRRQDRVITVSCSTRDDVVTRAGVPIDRVSVVPNGVDLSRFGPASGAGGDPYILYVARLEHPGKNHVRLLEAFAQLRRDGCRHRLVLAGPRWSGAEAIDAAIARLGLAPHVTLTGFVPNDELPRLYAAADAFVFPSLFEGFGIPLLEAMASGTPSCASNVSSLPEVAGDAALLFDPHDPAAITDALRRVLQDEVLRARLRVRGLRRVAEFTWERSARGVLAAIDELVPPCA